MIYLTKDEVALRYGKKIGGFIGGRFNVHDASRHDDSAYRYEFGYINGQCAYSLIQKKKGGHLTLDEADGLRLSVGNGIWKINLALDPTKDTKAIHDILTDNSTDIGYRYTPTAQDRFQKVLLSVHQRQRQQLLIYHPEWRPDLSQVSAKPIS